MAPMNRQIIALTLWLGCTRGWQQQPSVNRLSTKSRRVFSRSAVTVSDSSCHYDVAIIGSGPAACSLATLLTASSPNPLKVALLSRNADKQWVPNYGCWTEEWAALDAMYAEKGVPGVMAKGVDHAWDDSECFFGEDSDGEVSSSSPEGSFRRNLGREYLRVSKTNLKALFYGSEETRKYNVIKEDVLGSAIGTNIFSPAGAVKMHPSFTELTLKESGRTVSAKVVVDACGTESPFTIRDGREKEGYQIAYGVECTVSGPGVTEARIGDYDKAKLTLFDYRSEAWRHNLNLKVGEKEENEEASSSAPSSSTASQHVINSPTFNYVMPLRGSGNSSNDNDNKNSNRVFFEETSLVARPAVSFQDCKDRLTARLEAQGVAIDEVGGDVSEVTDVFFCFF